MYKNEINKSLQNSTGTALIFRVDFLKPNNVDWTGFICTEDTHHNNLHFSELPLLNLKLTISAFKTTVYFSFFIH